MRLDWLGPYIPGVAGMIFAVIGYAVARYSRALGQAGAKREREAREQAAE